jgi:hypothetical protein
MKEQLESLNYQQLLRVAREYNKKVSIPLPTNVSKEDLVKYIQTHAKDVGELLSILSSVRSEEKPLLPMVKRIKGELDVEYEARVRKRERGLRALARAKTMYEPLDDTEKMSKADEKAYKAKVKELKARYTTI